MGTASAAYTLCHVSGVQTRRKVVAGAVCRSIVTQAAMNRALIVTELHQAVTAVAVTA